MCLRNIIQNYKVNLKNLFWYANIFCVYIYAMFCVDPQRFKKKTVNFHIYNFKRNAKISHDRISVVKLCCADRSIYF